jgi:hypothetical protein
MPDARLCPKLDESPPIPASAHTCRPIAAVCRARSCHHPQQETSQPCWHDSDEVLTSRRGAGSTCRAGTHAPDLWLKSEQTGCRVRFAAIHRRRRPRNRSTGTTHALRTQRDAEAHSADRA